MEVPLAGSKSIIHHTTGISDVVMKWISPDFFEQIV